MVVGVSCGDCGFLLSSYHTTHLLKLCTRSLIATRLDMLVMWHNVCASCFLWNLFSTQDNFGLLTFKQAWIFFSYKHTLTSYSKMFMCLLMTIVYA